MGIQEPVLRASVRASSGDATATASAEVNRRTTEEMVAALRWSFAEPGQMSRMAVAAGASMDTVTARPAYTMMWLASLATTVTVVPLSAQTTCT